MKVDMNNKNNENSYIKMSAKYNQIFQSEMSTNHNKTKQISKTEIKRRLSYPTKHEGQGQGIYGALEGAVVLQ